MSDITIKSVDGYNRYAVPEPGETIADDIDLRDEFISAITSVEVYFRDPEACPFGRGNWVIDFHFGNKTVFLKLPKEMKEEHVHKFCKPLFDKLEHNEKDKKWLM